MQVPAMQTSLRKENSTSNSTIEFPSVSRLGGSPNFAARSNRTRESKTQATHDSSAALNAKFATELAAVFGELRLAAPARGRAGLPATQDRAQLHRLRKSNIVDRRNTVWD